jgi:hypothetical protein
MKSALQLSLSNKIQRSASRLASLCAADASDLLIENERQILMRLLFRFPADSASYELLLAAEREVQQAEQQHLEATGYYRGL